MKYLFLLLLLSSPAFSQVIKVGNSNGNNEATCTNVSGGDITCASSKVTIPNSGGLSVTYGVSAGSVTVPNTILTSTTSILAGPVGIGTASPATGSVLNVVTTAASTQAVVSGYSDLGGVTAQAGQIGIGSQQGDRGILQYSPAGNTTLSLDNTYDSGSAVMQFRMRTGGTPVTAVTILGSGNVGIGTASPSEKLQISSGTMHFDGTGSPTQAQALCINSAGQLKTCTSVVGAGGGCTCP